MWSDADAVKHEHTSQLWLTDQQINFTSAWLLINTSNIFLSSNSVVFRGKINERTSWAEGSVIPEVVWKRQRTAGLLFWKTWQPKEGRQVFTSRSSWCLRTDIWWSLVHLKAGSARATLVLLLLWCFSLLPVNKHVAAEKQAVILRNWCFFKGIVFVLDFEWEHFRKRNISKTNPSLLLLLQRWCLLDAIKGNVDVCGPSRSTFKDLELQLRSAPPLKTLLFSLLSSSQSFSNDSEKPAWDGSTFTSATFWKTAVKK